MLSAKTLQTSIFVNDFWLWKISRWFYWSYSDNIWSLSLSFFLPHDIYCIHCNIWSTLWFLLCKIRRLIEMHPVCWQYWRSNPSARFWIANPPSFTSNQFQVSERVGCWWPIWHSVVANKWFKCGGINSWPHFLFERVPGCFSFDTDNELLLLLNLFLLII